MKRGLLAKTRDLIQWEKRPTFFRELDLYGLEENILIGVSGALAKGFRLRGEDILLKSGAELDDFERRLVKFLNSLPEGTRLHFLIRSRGDDMAPFTRYAQTIELKTELSSIFLKSKEKSYEINPFLEREIFLFVLTYPEGLSKRFSFFPDLSSAFGRKADARANFRYETEKQKLLFLSDEIESSMRDLGIGIEALPHYETLSYLYEFLSPSYSKDVPFEELKFSDSKDPSSLRSKLLIHPPLIELEYFYLDRFYHQAVNLLRLPEQTSLKSMKDFELSLGKDYFLSLTIEVPDQEKEKAEIRRFSNFAKASNFFARAKEHDALIQTRETDELLSEIAQHSDKLFYVSLSVLVRNESYEECLKRSSAACRAFRKFGGAQAILDHMNHDRLFLSFLPLQGDLNPLGFIVPSRSLAHLLPLQASWPGTNQKGLLLKTYLDEPLRLDIFDSKLQAKHSVMLGSTGSGKSFFTNHLLLHFLMESQDHEVIVIDLGGSYRKLAEALGGSYLEVECSEKYALNPFPVKDVLFPRGAADSTFIQFLKELLEKMIDPKREWRSSEKMILERVIRSVYEPLSGVDAPLLGSIQKALRNFEAGDEEDKKRAYEASKELALFTEGEYGKILNQKGRFDISSRFTVFDLRKISQYPELQEILLLIIPFALKRKFENLSLKKLLVLDECWRLLKDTQGLELVEIFYRTARKMNAGVLSISQNPDDFLASSVSSVMINNSPTKFILRLKEGHEKLSAFGFNENEIKAAGELEVRPGHYSEIFIKFDDKSVISRLAPSSLEYWAATTDPLDLAEEERLRHLEPHQSILEILETLSLQYPNGVKKSKESEHG